jgi:outer membrane protein
MKKFYVLCLLIIIAFSGAFVNAQTLKFGHLNMQSVLTAMPEYTQALDSLKKMNDKYATQEETLQVEFNRKYADLTENQAGMDSLILQSKISELQSMQQNLEAFQQLASDKLQKLQNDLLSTIMKKLEGVVKQVGEELDLIYVFDISAKNPVYASDKSIDIYPMVKEKLKLP